MTNMSTSNRGAAKVYRAISHIENAERLIAGLPSIYFQGKERRETVRQIVRKLQEIADEVRANLGNIQA